MASRSGRGVLAELALSAALLAGTMSHAGETEALPSGELAGPYEDRTQAMVTFGQRSFYLSPWRAYMDTWPAEQFLDCLGVGWGGEGQELEPVAQVCEEAGIRRARVEFGWGHMTFDDPSKLNPDGAKRATAVLQALQKHHIRPLILLNAHHGVPCPLQWFDVKLTQDAAKGAREIVVDKVDRIRPKYTGLTNLTTYLAAFPMIVKVDADTKKCELSAPLPKDLKAGKLQLSLLKFQPFAGKVFEDGTPNPAAQETVDGWMAYAAGICRLAREALGTEGRPDAGFTLEVWNEYSFGSNFLDISRYYEPKLKFKEPLTYTNHGRSAKGCELILPLTVDYVNDPKNGLPGVGVLSGFANQRPWDSGSAMWPGQAGISRHYYTSSEPREFSPQALANENSGPLNALGKADGTPDKKDWHTVLKGSFFVPLHTAAMPEYVHFGYKTEFITRDVQPFPSTTGGPISFAGHHRYSHPGTGRPGPVWQTETNWDRGPFAARVMKASGCAKDDPRLKTLMHATGAKVLLRMFTFYSHKGQGPMTMFALKQGDNDLAILPQAFFKALKEAKYELTPEVRAQVGPQLTVIARVARLMREGKPMDVARKLEVAKLVEHNPQLVFKGDGTPAHPDRWRRDDFACLPFQLDAGRFAIGYYVVTRNMTTEWDTTKDVLDPARYNMPEQRFDLTLADLRGKDAQVSAWDPLTDKEVAVKVLGGDGTTLTVQAPTVDYPRFLVVKESAPGPLVQGVQLRRDKDGKPELAFTANIGCTATVTCGPFPAREGSAPALKPQAVEAGRETAVPLPELGGNDAVQLVLEKDGLTMRWPQWPHDVRGVAQWAFAQTAAPQPAVAQSTQSVLPALPEGKRPSGYDVKAGEWIKWREPGGRVEITIGAGDDAVRGTIETQALSVAEAALAFPPASAVDGRTVTVEEWGGVQAWKGVFALDATAHPGLKELYQECFICPLQKGAAVLTLKAANKKAFDGKRSAVEAVLKSVVWKE